MTTIYTMNGQPAISQQNASNLTSRISRIEKVVPYSTGGGGFAPSRYSPLISTGVNGGRLDLTSQSSIAFKGSMAPAVVDGNFGASATATTITWYWDGTNSSRVIVLRRSDGTSVTIPGSSITISGLTASQTYSYFPCWPSNGSHNVAWAGPGDTGTPVIAYSAAATATQLAQAAAFQVRSGFEPLTAGAMTFAQPAGGTSGGTGGGGGALGKCVMLGTNLKPLGNEQIDTVNHKQSDWVRIETDTNSLNCTPNHPLYDSEQGKVDASFFLGKHRWIITDQGEKLVTCAIEFVDDYTKVEVRMKSGHIFFANGFMSHNIKYSPL